MREDQKNLGEKVGHRKRTTINKDSVDEYLAITDQKEQLEQGEYVSNIMAGSKAKEERKQYVKNDGELTQISRNVQIGYGKKIEKSDDEKAVTKQVVQEAKENIKNLNKQRKEEKKGKSFAEKRTIDKKYKLDKKAQKEIKDLAEGKDIVRTHKQTDKKEGHVTISIANKLQGTAVHAKGKDQIDAMKNRTRAATKATRPDPIKIQPERPQPENPHPEFEQEPLESDEMWSEELNRERTQTDPDLSRRRK